MMESALNFKRNELATRAPPFSHPKNITVGKGRVIYVTESLAGSEGWVLPGGERTTDEARARGVAELINQLSSTVVRLK